MRQEGAGSSAVLGVKEGLPGPGAALDSAAWILGRILELQQRGSDGDTWLWVSVLHGMGQAGICAPKTGAE